MSFSVLAVLLALSCLPGDSTQASQLCKEGAKGWWYDIHTAKCRPCTKCPSRAFTMEPCTDFMDTMCIDIGEIEKSIHGGGPPPSDGQEGPPHKWHEMEGLEWTTPRPFITATVEQATHVLFYMGSFLVLMSVILLVVYVRRNGKFPLGPVNPDIHPNNRFLSTNNRLTRDHFNTTEYMNNLATLDRRLAMDEILEKRKKAIFEPPILLENIYVDEIIDLSTIPRNQEEGSGSEEPEHRRWLLRLQD